MKNPNMTLLDLMLKMLIMFVISGLLIQTTHSKATLAKNGYRGVSVVISPVIQSNRHHDLITSIQNLFQKASKALFVATDNRVYFASINIWIPETSQPSKTYTYTYEVEYDDFSVLTMDSADILIDVPNAAYGDLPYTVQTKSCGEPGEFIHLTESFLLNPRRMTHRFGPQENMVAREWIKYQYGIFDENGIPWDPVYPQKYYSAGGIQMYNMCNSSQITFTDSTTCDSDNSANGLPTNCILNIDSSPGANQNLTTSVMSIPILPTASKLCTSSQNHNADAPNKHNFLCRQKSAMEVILQHDDFQQGKNAPIPEAGYTVFSVKNSLPQTLGLVVVWDPMTATQVNFSLRPALLKFIYDDFPNGSYFGAVNTENGPDVFLNLTRISEDRQSIWQQFGNGLTSSEASTGNISEAVNLAIMQLDPFRATANHDSAILVMSNNVNNKSPELWSEMCHHAQTKGHQLHLVTYNQDVAKGYVSGGCQGRVFKIQTADYTIADSDEINQCLIQLQERAQLEMIFVNLPSILSPTTFLTPLVFIEKIFTKSTTDVFYVDTPKPFSNTYFYVETCLNIKDTSPDNLIYGWIGNWEQVQPLGYDAFTSAFAAVVPMTHTGPYPYGVSQDRTDFNFSAPFLVYAVGKPVPSKLLYSIPRIEAYSWVISDLQATNGHNWTRVRIYTSVKLDRTPVFNARVDAVVTWSDKFRINSKSLSLTDNGDGNPDIADKDGIYSGYFTQLGNPEKLYSAKVTVSDNFGTAHYPTQPYPWISSINFMKTESTGPFTRILQTAPFFGNKPAVDVIPPGPIYDLYLKSIINTSVTFSWTAPGNDLDNGIADQYNFKCSLNRNDLTDHFDDVTSVSQIPYIKPEMAKTRQQVTFIGLQDGNTYYCALKAADLTNYSPVSNIASYYITQQADNGNSESNQTFGSSIMDWIMYVIDFMATSFGMTACVCCICKRIRHRRSKICEESKKSCKKSAKTKEDTVKIYLTPININRLVVDDQHLKEEIESRIINIENNPSHTSAKKS